VTERRLAVIGVPTSAGAFAPGQEQAPAALRQAGLIDRLAAAGLAVRDDGDAAVWRWRPDRENPQAQNLGKVMEIVRDTSGRVAKAADAGETTLVFGGDCTVGIGTVAGHAQNRARVGLVYFDLHADLNVPTSVRPGALDWMGLAHMLAEDAAAPELASVGDRTPLLEPDQVVLLGWGPEQATPHEREAIDRLALDAIPVDAVRATPADAAARALHLLLERCDRVLVHFDVDVIDFTDTPLSENPGRNEGVAYEQAMAALEVLLRSPSVAGLTLTELNPAHVEEGARSVERLAGDLAAALS
jgi:arginase